MWQITDFDGLSLAAAVPAADLPLREPREVGRLVVPPGLWKFPLKARYDFINACLERDRERETHTYQSPLFAPPDADPRGQDPAFF